MGALEGKVALITGGGTGIGEGIALKFAAEGARVVIAARRSEPLEAVAAKAPENISFVTMDLSKRADREAALHKVIERHGKLDVLVNNAAYQLWKPFAEITEEEITDLYFTNMTSITLLIKSALPLLEKTRGNIVNISSTAGRYVSTPSDFLTVYSASKAGLNQLTRSLAPEIGALGVRINAVAPGVTLGEFALDSMKDIPGHLDGLIKRTALGRVGAPDDIARAVAFLASDEAAWVTGQVLDAAGGWQIG